MEPNVSNSILKKRSKERKNEEINDTNSDIKTSNEHINNKSSKRNLSEDQYETQKKKAKIISTNHTLSSKNDIIQTEKNIHECNDIEKHKNSEDNDNINEASKSPNNEDDNNEKMVEEIITEAERKEITGKSLRINFSSNNSFDVLRKFVIICNENIERDLASEYLIAGGNILEVLRLLDVSDKQMSNVVTVFSAVNLLLMKILAQYPQQQPAAIEACRHLINSHLSLLHSMISGPTKQRKLVLQLLTAMVSLGGNLPREILAHISLKPEIVESLVRHKTHTDHKSIRTCFIHFILAFLIEGNTFTIKTLLEKRNLLTSIFPGLIYDSKDVVNLVLTTIKTYILQNTGINKTAKLYVFSTSVIQDLMTIYNWKGPSHLSKIKYHTSVSSEEKEIVVNILHEFLTVLLTSHRHGIIFHDYTLGTSREKHNQLINTVLQSLQRPWEHEKVADIIIKIMIACPDLIKLQFSLLEPFLEPRESIKWITIMKFVRKIIECVDVNACLKTSVLKLNALQLSNALTSLVLPSKIIKSGIIPSLTHDSIAVQYEAVILLTIMCQQIKKFFVEVEIIFGRENTNFHIFKHSITDYIMKNVPNVDLILSIWCPINKSNTNNDLMKDTNDIAEPTRKDHLDAVLDLLHVYNDTCPKLLNTALELEPATLLATFDKLNDLNNTELNAMKVRTIQFLHALDSSKFTPQTKVFNEALSLLLPLLDENSTVSSHAKIAVRLLLNSCDVLEGCSGEVDIWINGFLDINDSNEKVELTNWFICIINSAIKQTDKYVNMIIEAEENAEQIYDGKVTNIFEALLHENTAEANITKDYLRLQSSTSISPLLCCALHRLKRSSTYVVLSYMSHVLVHMLHSQVVPSPLIHLTSTVTILPIRKYLMGWLECDHPTSVKKLLPSMDIMSKLSKALLANDKIQFANIFNGTTALSFTWGNEDITINYSLSTYEITCLFRMTIFYLAQIARRGDLNEIQNINCKFTIIIFLHMAQNTDNRTLAFANECLLFIFNHPFFLQYFSPLRSQKDNVKSMITLTILDICKNVVSLYASCDLQGLFLAFKNKFIAQLKRLIEKGFRKHKDIELKNAITCLEILQLTSQDIVELLNILSKLDKSMFVLKGKSNLSMYGYIVPKLLQMLCNEKRKCTRASVCDMDGQFITRICTCLIDLKSDNITEVDQWEDGLWLYLCTFPHNIVGINSNMFSSFLSKRISSTTIKVIALLIGRNVKFIPLFIKYIKRSEDIRKNNIVLPILANNSTYKWPEEFLQKLSICYKSEIISYFSDPGSSNPNLWIEEDVNAISYLIEKTFDLTTCKEICDIILRSGDKLDRVSVAYIRGLQSVYSTYTNLKTDGENPFINFVHILIHIFTLTLKKESKNVQKMDILCKLLITTVKDLKGKEKNFILHSLCSNHSWLQFTRLSLKLGLKDHVDLPILKLLTVLCNVAYQDDSDNPYVKILFEMTTSHSEFVNLMLGSSTVKRNLVELLWILIRKNKSVMSLSHVPLYLAAYGATLSEVDQLILLILQHYEKYSIKVYEYRPYLWGTIAISHYSIKGETDTTLWRQPSTSQVFNLFDKKMIENTIKNYPVSRTLKNHELCNPQDVYDPAFYLPLLCHLLSENNVIACHKAMQCGALALALVACGSKCDDTRMAAYTVISRYYFHVEASSSKEKLLWMQLIDVLRNGIMSLQHSLHNVQISCLVSVFLARTSLIITQPLHSLYSPLQTFLMAKPALDINKIPELLQLFHSSDIDFKEHRHWILKNIRDGIKTENDVDLALKCLLYKVLLDFYTCTLCDGKTKKLILEVVNVTLKFPKPCRFFIHGYGLLPWLSESIKHLNNSDGDLVDLIINIGHNLSNILLHVKEECIHYRPMLLNILLDLRNHLSKDISLTTFILYINDLLTFASSKLLKNMMNKQDVKHLIDISSEFLGNIEECDDMLNHGCKFIQKPDDTDVGVENVEAARNILKKFVWTWCRQH